MAEEVKKVPMKEGLGESKFAKEVREATIELRIVYEVALPHVIGSPGVLNKFRSMQARGFSEQEAENLTFLKGFLALDPKDEEQARLKDLFEFCNLDAGKMAHWRVLLQAITNTGLKGPGAPPTLTDAFFYELLNDIRALRLKRPNLKTNSEIATFLLRDSPFKGKYDVYKNDYLRKLVGTAQDPKRNKAESLSDEKFRDDWAKIQADTHGLPFVVAKAFIDRQWQIVVEEFGFDPGEALKELNKKFVSRK